ncbi:MAG: DUF2007 domain-containing protein [Cytophagales bacterium]|nr:DUF2007 domain-containing protein [Bernardetiaceae bacterium]MDW8211631.1 DUF2007 domain-containing protein [Cytophagales bacterium]
MSVQWQKVYDADHPLQAEVIKNFLQLYGIQAVIINKQDSSYGLFGQVEVHVLRKDVLKAIHVLKNGLETNWLK